MKNFPIKRQSSSGAVYDRLLNYDHRSVQTRWNKAWIEAKLNIVNIGETKKPFYNLMMFPYPSAEGLHVGNMYAFTGSDIYGRFKRMQGYDVFEPIGLDGFGIHSENYALKIGRHPMDHAKITEENFYKQLSSIGAMFDWTRTVATYDPDYYRWTQWLFVQMFKRGLAYRAKASVNWCPSCNTVLADEQVIDGKCERCGNTVDKRLLEQWFFRITAYAEKLLENTNSLDWSKKVLIAQREWIGKKEGINITYHVKDSTETIVCFTTTPVNWAATFLVLSPEHPLSLKLTTSDHLRDVKSYIDIAKRKKPEERIAQGREKTGVFTGSYAINHVNGEAIPIWISDFVIMSVGTGAIQACPGHDLRDFEFAMKFQLPIKRVVVGSNGDTSPVDRSEKVIQAGESGTMINSDFLNGMTYVQAMETTKEYFEKKGWGKRVTTYHLRDWLISRQRYWGPPIPMIYCQTCAGDGKSWFTTDEAKYFIENPKFQIPMTKQTLEIHARSGGWYPVPEDQLPVELPRIDDYKPSGDGISPLARHKEFYETSCPGCGGKAVRETDVSDTFLDSSWYFLRYPSVGLPGPYRSSSFDSSHQGPDPLDIHGGVSAKAVMGLEKTRRTGPTLTGHSFVDSPPLSLPWDPNITKKWLPVNMYTGGAEHSVLHLMYSRFVTMALYDMGYIDFDEPFPHFYAHGLIVKDGAKMSKSKGNVVNPDDYIATYGTDSLRLYLMFTGPFNMGGDFRDSAMEGMRRWINRIWKLSMATISSEHSALSRESANKPEGEHIVKLLNTLVKKITDDMEKRRYNTAIASMMEFTNRVTEVKAVLSVDQLSLFLKLLAPFAPYLTEELWSLLGHDNSQSGQSIHTQLWPEFDDTIVSSDVVTVVIQINGKLRDSLQLPPMEALDQKRVETFAKKSVKTAGFLVGKIIQKVIFVPGKLINFVVS